MSSYQRLSTDKKKQNHVMILGYTGRGTGADVKSGIGKILQPAARLNKYDVYLFAHDAMATKLLTTDLKAHLQATKGTKCRAKFIVSGHSFGATRAVAVGKWFSKTASKLVPSVWHEVHVITIDAIKDLRGDPATAGCHDFTSFVNLYQTQGKKATDIAHTICGGPLPGATNRVITLYKNAIPKGHSPHTAIDDILSVPMSRYVKILAAGRRVAAPVQRRPVAPR